MAVVLEILFSVFGELFFEILLTGAFELLSGTPAPAHSVIPAHVTRERSTPEALELSVLDGHAPDAERLASLAALLALPGEPSRVLQLLLADPSPAMRTEAVAALGKARIPDSFAAIARLRGATPAEEAAIVTALARLGGADAETRILRFLANGSPEAQLAAARVLRFVGTLAAVGPLGEKANAWFSGDLAKKAASAIEAIQQRHARAAPGALSMSARGLRGELSIAAPVGALSMKRANVR